MIIKAATKVALLGAMSAVFTSNLMSQDFLFRSNIVGSNPKTIIAGVQSGGAPWTVQRGSARLNDDGRLRVELRDLILPNLGNPGPVTNVSASLVCGGAGGTVVATTDPVPLSGDGNAEIEGKISSSGVCFAPIVLIQAAGFNGTLLQQPGPWIAATGFAQVPDASGDKEDEGK